VLRPAAAGEPRVPAFARALHRAAALLGPAPHPLVLVVTDGRSDETAGHVAAAVAVLPPGSVHVLATAPLPAAWSAVPVGSVTAVDEGPVMLDRLDGVVTKVVLLAAVRSGAASR
jgi:hypothetical protein